MTNRTATPGCFKSALYFSVRAAECARCGLRDECKDSQKSAVRSAADALATYDRQHGTEALSALLRSTKTRFRPDVRKDQAHAEALAHVEKLRAMGINVFEIRHGRNPVPPTKLILRSVFQAIIALGDGFTRGDIFNEVYQANREHITRPKTKAIVDQMCAALVVAGVLRTEKRGIYCINR